VREGGARDQILGSCKSNRTDIEEGVATSMEDADDGVDGDCGGGVERTAGSGEGQGGVGARSLDEEDERQGNGCCWGLG